MKIFFWVQECGNLWGFHPDFVFPSFAYHPGMLRASTSVVPQSHHQGAPEMKQFCPGMYQWGGSGGTTHSGRYHWGSVCDNTEGPLTPRRASTTVPSGGAHGSTGSNRIRSTPSSSLTWIRVDTDINLQLSLFSNSTSSFIHGHIQGRDS